MREKKDVSYYTYTKHPELIKEFKSEKKLVWNVFFEEFNKREIVVFNIFDHGSFKNAVKLAAKKFKDDFDGFSTEIEHNLMYYFWSKSEYEVIVTSWPPYIEAKELDRINQEVKERQEKGYPFYRESVNLSIGEKIDIYDQVKMNWPQFIEYLWSNLDLVKKLK